MTGQGQPLLEVSGIRKHFRTHGAPWRAHKTVQAVTDVSFTIPKGQALGLVGESGSGKSTIARCILGIEKADAGSIALLGDDVTKLRGAALRSARRNLQAIFQDPASSLNPRWTVAQAIADPLRANGASHTDAMKRVKTLTEQVGLSERHLAARPHELSGGQQQRAGIARALTLEPALIVADEPLSALDVSIQAQVLNVLVELKKSLGQSYLFISHDLRVTRHLCETIAVCYLGSLVEIGPADEVLKNPQHPYTAALVSAMPLSLAELGKPRERIVLAGELPSPVDPPSGCRFRTRCFRATEECAVRTPTLEPVASLGLAAAGEHRAACFFPMSTAGEN